MNYKIALLCKNGHSSEVVANALRERFGSIAIIVEDKESRGTFLKRRLRRLGFFSVMGQIAFTQLIAPIIRRISGIRIKEILDSADLHVGKGSLDGARHVQSINGQDVVEWLRKEKPDVIVVNGTRIIGRRVLQAVNAKFINSHCGITPEYRGAHGGYWALANGEPECAGVTIHLVDEGIDTGDILAQQIIQPQKSDNFATYPYLQLAAAVPLLIKSVEQAICGQLKPYRREATSGLWFHPTAWQYLATGLRKSIW